MLQFFEVPPGGSVVSPLFFSFFLFFVFAALVGSHFFHVSHFFRIFSVFLCDLFPSLRFLFKKIVYPATC